MPPLNDTLHYHAEKRAHAQLQRHAREMHEDGVTLTHGVREYVSFAGNDYLGLRQHKSVVAAAQSALVSYGAGAGASRLLTGTHPLYALLEERLAASKNAEAALAFGSGYGTSLGVIPALVGKDDIIFADKLSHACMIDGAQLSGATLKRFAHNDMAHLETLLNEHRANHKNALIMSEHIFSMDGDMAPMQALEALKKKHDCWLMIDDAHGLGVHESTPMGEVDVWMGTLSKAAGSYGGYVIGSAQLRDHLVNCARSFMFSTGLPPSVVAASAEALRLMAEAPDHRSALWRNVAMLADALGVATQQSAIFPIIVGDADAALAAHQALLGEGVFVPAIRPPTVPAGTARLRVSISALHSDEQMHALIEALRKVGVIS